ncbi:hypothetical protein CONLIGDRAFT_184343 [Coniochaeta ligniaria NRRL 30616]|uniref:F-box domain-containing protein n=1 Tax=Coniochaeta ligniaria NRRL 30616 TaxID=1408157 RepID=A0A1J7J1E5_9PEZI|nr:hypothetical protein CONLIGDRAFT_184343 [Coniochaeta ligniaria NRRL 30616]
MLVCPLPNLRSICIIRSAVNEPDLEQLLSCCVGLETFVYNIGTSFHYILPSDIIRCLRKFKETLATLCLSLQNDDVLRQNLLFKPLPSLRHFSGLEDLLLDAAFIYNCHAKESPEDCDILVQLLPSSIVSLRLEATASAEICVRLAKALLRLAEAASLGQFPSMEEVRCYAEERLADDGLSEKFASAGVDFCYELWEGGVYR